MYAKLTDREILIAANNTMLAEQTNPNIDYKNKVCVKPWGHEFLIFQNSRIAIWHVTIKKGSSTSLHCHFKKDTLLITLSGNAKIAFIDGAIIALNILEPLFIPRYKFHSISSFSDETVIMEMEIFNNELTFSDKNDLLRIEDPFKREKTGYETSIQLADNIAKWDYFYIEDGFNKNINTTNMRTYTVETNNHIIDKNNVNILLNGELFVDNKYVREGTILTTLTNTYTLTKKITILTLQNINKKEDSKILYDIDHLKTVLTSMNDKKVVLTSGCFDIIHVGHLHSLKVAKSLGDILIVCLSNDAQIKKLKGLNRPINNYDDRINLFKTINYVDFILLYDEEDTVKEETLDKIIRIVNPHCWVKGSDYNKEDILLKHPSLQNIHLIDNIKGKSSTSIINKIKSHEVA